MPIFRFDKALHVVRGVKNILNGEGGVSRGASPDVDEQHENGKRTRRRISVLKKES